MSDAGRSNTIVCGVAPAATTAGVSASAGRGVLQPEPAITIAITALSATRDCLAMISSACRWVTPPRGTMLVSFLLPVQSLSGGQAAA